MKNSRMSHKLLFFVAYQTLLIAWCFYLQNHFFGLNVPNQIGLLITALSPICLWKYNKIIPSFISVFLLIALPMGIVWMIGKWMTYFDSAWIINYLLLLITGVCILSFLKYKLKWLILPFLISLWFLPYPLLPNQLKYTDFVAKTIQTRKGEADIVVWKNEKWIYYNNSLLVSTVDGHLYSETTVHTVLPLFENPNILLLGGDHGLISNELKKYDMDYLHLPYDWDFYVRYNEQDKYVRNESIESFIATTHNNFYDIIFVDMPDPISLEFTPFYEMGFFEHCLRSITQQGILVINISEDYYTHASLALIFTKVKEKGYGIQILRNHIPTLGFRTWVLMSNKQYSLSQVHIPVATKWINQEAIQMMLALGALEPSI